MLAAQASGDAEAAAQAQSDLNAANARFALWSDDGTGRIGLHALVAGGTAALGGGNVGGAVAGTVAGDLAGNAVNTGSSPATHPVKAMSS